MPLRGVRFSSPSFTCSVYEASLPTVPPLQPSVLYSPSAARKQLPCADAAPRLLSPLPPYAPDATHNPAYQAAHAPQSRLRVLPCVCGWVNAECGLMSRLENPPISTAPANMRREDTRNSRLGTQIPKRAASSLRALISSTTEFAGRRSPAPSTYPASSSRAQDAGRAFSFLPRHFSPAQNQETEHLIHGRLRGFEMTVTHDTNILYPESADWLSAPLVGMASARRNDLVRLMNLKRKRTALYLWNTTSRYLNSRLWKQLLAERIAQQNVRTLPLATSINKINAIIALFIGDSRVIYPHSPSSQKHPDLADLAFTTFISKRELCPASMRRGSYQARVHNITGDKTPREDAYYKYKYLFDVDGNTSGDSSACSSRSGSLVFKMTAFEEFF
ncbi:hypothetical protein C8J57DRAFT_1720297 [Mycena rebaudengoi]|nr:hypothetical protein C8J57DRAFT_1720297 [Mycena rebaudengoi]